MILVAANFENTWARSAPASCESAITSRRRVARARGSLNIVSPLVLKIVFHLDTKTYEVHHLDSIIGRLEHLDHAFVLF